jgi:hypothetical protein
MITKRIHNIETNEIEDTPLTEAELAEFEKQKKTGEVKAAEYAELEAKKKSAEEKLAALGLTADDLKALGLGGN